MEFVEAVTVRIRDAPMRHWLITGRPIIGA